MPASVMFSQSSHRVFGSDLGEVFLAFFHATNLEKFSRKTLPLYN